MSRVSARRLGLLAGGCLLGLAAVAPWASLSTAAGTASVSGLEDGSAALGLLCGAAAVAALLAGWTRAAMRLALGSRARLVTVEDGAHVVAFNAINRCADEHATAFLVSGRLPADAYCARDAAGRALREPVADGLLYPQAHGG